MSWSARDQHHGDGEVFITGGGTAGHVLPALAVGRALVAGGRDQASIHFVGSQIGMERRLVPEAGFSITLLPGRGIARKLTSANFAAVAGLLRACALAARLVRVRRPAAIVTVGGYAGVATSLAGLLFGVPVVVVNLDAVPGAANRLIGRFAAASAVALPATPLPRAIVTGAPVRSEVLAVGRSDEGRRSARAVLGIETEPTIVAITGGSLGARRLNDCGLGLARILSGRHNLMIYHVAGRRDFEQVTADAKALGQVTRAGGLDYRVVEYEPHVPELLAAADLVICRAGASTVAEIAVIGTPSILVPLPGAPSDHQRRNAEVLARHGAAIMVVDEDATATRLAPLVVELLDDPDRRTAMTIAAIELGAPDAAARVATIVTDVIGKSHRRTTRIRARRPGST